MKNNILKSLFISVILLAGTSNVWGQNNCDFLDPSKGGADVVYIKYSKNNASAVQQNIPNNGQSDIDLGTVTSLKITEFRGLIKKHDGNVCAVRFHYGINSNRDGNKNNYIDAGWSNDGYDNWTWDNWWAVEQYKNKNVNLDVLSNLSPGAYYFDFYFTIYGNNSGTSGCYENQKYWSNNGGNYHIKFTVPGFTKASTSQAFDNTTVASSSSKTISFGTHYGTALRTSNCSIAGTNASEFTVTSINESGVTVTFNPTSAGNKTATLTITDAHSKKCTITLSAKTQYTVTYSKGNYGTGNNVTDNKVYGTALTLKDKGNFTREHYTQTAWNTNANGTGGTSYALKASYTQEAALQLYPTWTPIEYNITYHLNGGTNDANNPATYNIEQTLALKEPTKTGYTFEGWYLQSDFSGDKVTQIAQGTTGDIALYAKWSETKYSVNINTNNRNWGITTPSGANWVGPTPVDLIATHHTGYHFVNWTATGGASIADPNLATTTITATASGTVTAHFAESLYDITVLSSNDTYGKVTQSAPQAGVTTAITITAEPKEGYEFTGWSKDGDITIASINSATTTLTATSAGTVTANFAPKGSTPIYFRANSGWKTDNARFAVYYNKIDNNKGWSELFEICGGDYYHADVPAECKELKIRRLKPKGSTGYQDVNDGLNNSNIWSETDFVPMPTDGKTMYDMTKIYLKPNGNWKSNGARFAVYFFDGTSTEKWVSMSPTTTDGLYYCDIPEGNYKQVNFCRMEPADATNIWENRWNQTKDLTLLFNTNCFTINDDEWGKGKDHLNDAGADGYWSLVNDEATYDVTLYSCSFGEYGFIYNNVEYTSPESGNITYQIPVNATVKVFSRPYSKEYRGDVMVNQSGTKWEITPDNLLNITCHTILDDNYKTTGEHEVYLAVPNNGGSWVTNTTATLHYLYAFHSRTDEGEGIPVEMTEVGHANVELDNKPVDHIYYRCVIPAEVNTIRFEKRSNATTTVLSTIDLRYDIPLNSVNCYRLDRPGATNNSYAGVWEHAPGFGSDFRLVHYRTAKDIYYSDIIRHGTISQTVSMHIYTKDANADPKLELQQRVNGNWVAISGQTKLVKDINKIMSDPQDQGCGVWNFTVTTDGGDNAKVNFDTPQRYTGNYYIRTNNAEGEWRNYTLSTNHMTFSSYAKTHSGYTHYYCRYIDVIDNSTVPGHNKNVKFIIANDYAAVLSNEMTGDSHTTSGGDLPESANVRWTWNEMTNVVSRAYILGSHGTTDHIVANGKRLNDQEDWIYEIDIDNVTQGQKLNIHADYPSKDIGTVKKTTQTFADNLEMIKTDASNQNSYTVRVMYDFKINKTLIMLCPDQLNGANIGVDVFIDRPDQGEASQVKPGAIVTSSKPEGYTVYSTLTLTKEHLTSTTKTEWERLYYWISFPFDVRISEIFGFGEYGKHYIIEYYDGAARAENGCWADSPTYWRQIKDTTYSPRTEELNNGNEDANGNPNNGILVANRGYVLALARNIANSNIFKHGNTYVRLYFPSREKITSIDANMQDVTAYLQPHTCTIEREDRNIYDSNWHIIGVPSYANKAQTLKEEDVLYFYTYNTANNTYNVTPAENASGNQTITFKSMHAYMVQYAGYINWKSWPLQEPQSVVARQQSAEAQENYALRLELQRDGQYADQAFVQLQAEGATADFDLNQDLTKIINAGANIYTLAGEKRIQVAGNVLPIAKTTIPVGIQVAQAGTYTIALPEGTSGISATLVDNQTGTHTNLLLEDYTITLDAGSHENRFYIVLDPERSATAVENINEAQGDKTQKFLIDGQLIIRTEQGVYNATGNNITNRQ